MLFYEIINDHPAEDPALICQDKMLTYGEVREEVTLWAAHLQSSGVCKGDKVGLFSKNCNEFVIAYLAIIKAGGVVVPFNFQLAAPEVAYIVQDAGMRVMVTRQKLELDAALQECGCGPLKQLDFENLRQPVDRGYEDIAMDDNDNCTIIYTFGSTAVLQLKYNFPVQLCSSHAIKDMLRKQSRQNNDTSAAHTRSYQKNTSKPSA